MNIEIPNSSQKNQSQSKLAEWKFSKVENNELYEPHNFLEETIEEIQSIPADIQEPIQLFLTDEVFRSITEFTNSKAEAFYDQHPQTSNSHRKIWEPTSIDEIKAFFGMLLHMGIASMPSYPLYWSKEEKFRIPGIADVMTFDRFRALKKFLYFTEINTESSQKNLKKHV